MQIAQHFHVSSEVATLTTALFLLGYVFGPPVWGPGSEIYGRLPMFWICMTAYTLLHLGQALAPNIQTLLITRFFSGFFAVAPLTNSGGTLGLYAWIMYAFNQLSSRLDRRYLGRRWARSRHHFVRQLRFYRASRWSYCGRIVRRTIAEAFTVAHLIHP
jgi:MFS family permease